MDQHLSYELWASKYQDWLTDSLNTYRWNLELLERHSALWSGRIIRMLTAYLSRQYNVTECSWWLREDADDLSCDLSVEFYSNLRLVRPYMQLHNVLQPPSFATID